MRHLTANLGIISSFLPVAILSKFCCGIPVYFCHQCPQNQENPIFWKPFGQSVDQSVKLEKDGKS
jgi:hypothetical protein